MECRNVRLNAEPMLNRQERPYGDAGGLNKQWVIVADMRNKLRFCFRHHRLPIAPMAPSNLQGLNVVHTAPAAGRDYASDSQNLLDFPTYRDYSSELDLWTNLAFESDEPLHRKRETQGAKPSTSDDGADEDDEAAAKESDMLYPGDAHENIVTGIPLPQQNAPSSATTSRTAPSLDLANFLTSFGIDPFGLQAQQLQQNASNIPTLAQLFAASPGAAATHSANFSLPDKTSPPASKRARTNKSSITSDTPEPEPESPIDNSTPANAAEDKRRRNTAASARFRLKKKEREAALEKKSKELETKVNELEKECEGLRRENGWLKGLVVGVTGGVAPQQNQASDVRVGAKRGREVGELDR